MKSIQFEDYGSPLRVVDCPVPRLQPGQLLIKMIAAAINQRDNNIHMGLFRHLPLPLVPSSHILGNEGAGCIVDSADEEQTYPLGTHVFFRDGYHLPCGGTWQEYVVATPSQVQPIPPHKDLLEAAALRTAYQSAYIALDLAGFPWNSAGDQIVFATSAGGGVGNAAIQLARAYGAQEPVTTAGSTAKAEKARSLGYSKVIDLTRESLQDGVMRLTNGEGVDIALDTLGGPYTAQALESLKPGKTLVLVGFTAGAEATIKLSELIGKRKHIESVNILSSPQNVFESSFDCILRLWLEDRVHPLIDRIFPAAEAQEAQRYQMEDRPFGKVLLSFE
jgi:NADPH2:quinone reductase